MKRKPSSAKKHKQFRRVRRTDWNESLRQMKKRESLVDSAVEEFFKGIENDYR